MFQETLEFKKIDIFEKQGCIKVADRCYTLPNAHKVWDIGKSEDNLDFKKLNKEYEKHFKEKNE